MNIVIITAMPEESGAIVRRGRLRDKSRAGGRRWFRLRLSGHEVVLVAGGMGMLNAGWAATALAAERPDLMISAGFGGAVRQGLAVGDLVMAEQLLQRSDPGWEAVEVGFYGRNAVAGTLSIPRGTFITCDRILNKRALAESLPPAHANPVVEMESAAVARIAAMRRIPFLALRSISDPAGEEMGFTIDEFCDDTMRIRPARVLATILRRPRIVPQLIRLARNSRLAAAGLGRGMERLLAAI